MPALTHLFDVAITRGDTAEGRRFFALIARVDTSASVAPYQYWMRTYLYADSARVQQIYQSMDTLDGEDLDFIQFGLLFGTIPVPPVRRSVEIELRKALTSVERSAALTGAYQFALNVGRPTEAARYATDAMRIAEANQLAWSTRLMVDALFWDGDSILARRTAERLPSLLPSTRGQLNAQERDATCAAGIWHATRGETRARERASALEALDTATAMSSLCVRTIKALLAHHDRQPNADALLASADSVAALGPPGTRLVLRALNFALARLYELRGSPTDALRAARRHSLDGSGEAQWSTRLRETARLAERTGDRATAIAAYRMFLSMRTEPEPALAYQTTEAHAALTRLAGDGR